MEESSTAQPHRPKPVAGSVMLGWFAAVIVAVVVIVLTRSTADPPNCGGWCFSDRFRAEIAVVVVGLPSLAVAVIVSLIVLRLFARRGWTGAVAGSSAAILGLVAGPIAVVVALAVYGAARSF
jgi:hypothetical protein